MTAPNEKAAPIPADIQLIAGTLVIPVSRTLSQEQCDHLFGAIMKAIVADRASQAERIREDERLRFEGDLDRWMKTLGAGITGYQPEAYAVMDAACAELARARARIAALEAEASEGERRGLERAAKTAEDKSIKPLRTVIRDGYRTPMEDSFGEVFGHIDEPPVYRLDYRGAIAAAIRALIPEAPAREGE